MHDAPWRKNEKIKVEVLFWCPMEPQLPGETPCQFQGLSNALLCFAEEPVDKTSFLLLLLIHVQHFLPFLCPLDGK